MKKITALLTMLLLVVSITYASTLLSFSGDSTLVGGNGRTIRKTDVTVDGKGIMVLAGDEKVTAEGEGIKVILGKDTIASIIDDGTAFTLYVVKGEGGVVTEEKRNIRLYTPTTLTEMDADGGLYVYSGDDYDYVFNYSSSSVSTFDEIRRTYTTIESGSGLDFLTKKIVSEEEKIENEITLITESWLKKRVEPTPEIEPLPRIPEMPVFVSVESTINVPDEPVITKNERILVETEESVVTEEESDAKPAVPAPSIKVTQTLVDSEDESGS